jgi:hypothetical protein
MDDYFVLKFKNLIEVGTDFRIEIDRNDSSQVELKHKNGKRILSMSLTKTTNGITSKDIDEYNISFFLNYILHEAYSKQYSDAPTN